MKKKNMKDGNVNKKKIIFKKKEIAQIEQEKNEKENKKQMVEIVKKTSKKKIILSTVVLILIVLLFSLILFNFTPLANNNSDKRLNHNSGVVENKNIDYSQKIEQMGNAVIEIVADRLTELKTGLSEQIELMSNNILSLKNENESLKKEIDNINLEIKQLKAQKTENNLNNIKLLISLIKLKNNFDSGFDYMEDLKLFKLFAKNSSLYQFNELALSLENALKKVRNIDVNGVFLEESEILMSKQWEKQNNKIMLIFRKNVSVRKVGDFSKEDENTLDYKIHIIQQQIRKKQYIKAIDTIKKYNLAEDLSRTVETISSILEINNIFNKVIDTVYLGYL